jgi:hypothetical protein
VDIIPGGESVRVVKKGCEIARDWHIANSPMVRGTDVLKQESATMMLSDILLAKLKRRPITGERTPAVIGGCCGWGKVADLRDGWGSVRLKPAPQRDGNT